MIGLLTVLLLTVSPAAPAEAGLRGRIFHMINGARVRHGLRHLRLNTYLSQVAHHHSERMSEENLLFHRTDLFQRMSRFRWHTYGENIGFATRLRTVFHMWMRSPEHRANILRAGFRKVGVGVVHARRGYWVTADFEG